MDYCRIKVIHRLSLKKDGVYPFCNIFGGYSQLLSEEAIYAAAGKSLDHESILKKLEKAGDMRIICYQTELRERTIIKVLFLKTGHNGYYTFAVNSIYTTDKKRERPFPSLSHKKVLISITS